jgi:hypothetical protein
MVWMERLLRPAKPRRNTRALRALSRPLPRMTLRAAPSWFGEERPERLAAMRVTAEKARRKRPKDPWAHAAFATALIAGVRAGLTDDLHEDALAALEAAERALALAPADPHIMALAAPALAQDDPPRAAELFAAAKRKLGNRLSEELGRAAREGARRPSVR